MENEAQKMISSTTADQKEVSSDDDVAMNQEGAKMEEDHQIGSGNDLALSDSSTTDQKGLKKDDASMNEGGTGSDFSSIGSDSSSTDQKDDASMNEGGTGSDSSVNDDACRSRFELSDSSRLLLASPIKRKFEWIPAKTETSSGKLYTTNLNHGEDLVDAVYHLSEAYGHRRHVSVVSAIGFVSKIVFRDGISAYGIFQITSLSLQCPTDKDGRSCRNKAACSVSMTSDYGTHNWTGVNFIAAKGPIEITAELEKEKSSGESSAAAAQYGNSDSGKAVEELEAFSKEIPAAYGNTNSSRLLFLSPIKRKFEWIPAETETTSGKLYTTNLNHKENVVDAVYQLSEAYDHRRLVSIVSATGFVSDIFFRDGLNAWGLFQITSLSLQCPADEDGRSCRNKAACSVSLKNKHGKTYNWTDVKFVASHGPIEITAELAKEKSAGESSAAQYGNSDYGKANEELEYFPTNSLAADGNTNSSRLLFLIPIKRKFEWIPAETETTSSKLYTTNLNCGEDVVDAVYHLSEAYNHRQLFGMVSATGSISKIVFFDGLQAHEISQITSLSLQYPADEDVHPYRNKAACSVSWTDDGGKTYKCTRVNYLVADGPIEITAELEEEKSAGESSAVAASTATAQDGNSDSAGAANDQDKMSPSEEDI